VQVFLEAGFAFVPMERLVSIIVARFRTTLSRALLDAMRSFPYILADTRCVRGAHAATTAPRLSDRRVSSLCRIQSGTPWDILWYPISTRWSVRCDGEAGVVDLQEARGLLH
jgi:hypothetical protein